MFVTVAGVATIIFYFKRTWVDDFAFIWLSRIEFVSAVLALVFGILFIRSWQGRITLVLLIPIFYLMSTITVGIH